MLLSSYWFLKLDLTHCCCVLNICIWSKYKQYTCNDVVCRSILTSRSPFRTFLTHKVAFLCNETYLAVSLLLELNSTLHKGRAKSYKIIDRAWFWKNLLLLKNLEVCVLLISAVLQKWYVNKKLTLGCLVETFCRFSDLICIYLAFIQLFGIALWLQKQDKQTIMANW